MSDDGVDDDTYSEEESGGLADEEMLRMLEEADVCTTNARLFRGCFACQAAAEDEEYTEGSEDVDFDMTDDKAVLAILTSLKTEKRKPRAKKAVPGSKTGKQAGNGGTTSKKRQKRAKKREGPKRAQNAYMFFSQTNRAGFNAISESLE